MQPIALTAGFASAISMAGPLDGQALAVSTVRRSSDPFSCSLQDLTCQEIATQTASFQRYVDPKGMIGGAEQVVVRIADGLAEFPNLRKLLRQPTPGGPPLLVAAFAFFFRREVETDGELAHGLFFDGLKQLSASQEQAFQEVGKALMTLGDKFEQVFEQLDRIETVVVETHSAVLDMQTELQRLETLTLAGGEGVRRLLEEVLSRVSQVGMQRGEVKPQHSCSIRSEDEKRAVKQLLARFRQLPADQQQQMPALLNGLGKLQIGSGDFDGARQTFVAVAKTVNDTAAQAEAHYNAYRAALEEKKWDEALQAIQQAASLDSLRFAPFPIQRYQPKRILGAGGFGTAFLCHDRNFEEEVVVKTLHAGDLERSLADVFREAKLLRRLTHTAIIGVHECEYADPSKHARPYIVMDYFPGGSLENFIQQRGTISPEHLLQVASQVAQGMQAAHKHGILHRDLKPDNILVRKEGNVWQVKIIDFGLALGRQTIETSQAAGPSGHTILSDSVAGTLKYAPPEQVGELRGVKPGPYSDVYSFGKMCCYALFKTTEPRRRQWAEISEYLAEMLEKCLEQSLEHRLLSFEPVLKVLEALERKRLEQEGAERKQQKLLRRQQEEAHQKAEEADWQQQVLFRGQQEEARQKAELERKRREQEETEKNQQHQEESCQIAEQERKHREQKEDEEQRDRHEQEEAYRQLQELERLQREGKTRLVKNIREALDRTQGKPTQDNLTAANEICNRHRIPKERAKQIVDDVKAEWQKAYSPKSEQKPGESREPQSDSPSFSWWRAYLFFGLWEGLIVGVMVSCIVEDLKGLFNEWWLVFGILAKVILAAFKGTLTGLVCGMFFGGILGSVMGRVSTLNAHNDQCSKIGLVMGGFVGLVGGPICVFIGGPLALITGSIVGAIIAAVLLTVPVKEWV